MISNYTSSLEITENCTRTALMASWELLPPNLLFTHPDRDTGFTLPSKLDPSDPHLLSFHTFCPEHSLIDLGHISWPTISPVYLRLVVEEQNMIYTYTFRVLCPLYPSLYSMCVDPLRAQVSPTHWTNLMQVLSPAAVLWLAVMYHWHRPKGEERYLLDISLN